MESRIRQNFNLETGNPGLQNPECSARNKESGIPLIFGIQNPSFTDKDLSPVADATATFWGKNNRKREEKQEKGWGSFSLILPLSFCHEMKAQN